MRPCAGVSFEDDGYKGGLNGIDNGRIAFDHVRVPRTNLLNKYGHEVERNENGQYAADRAALLARSAFASDTAVLRDAQPVPAGVDMAVLPPVSGG